MFEFAFYFILLALFLVIFGDKIFNTLVFNKEYKGLVSISHKLLPIQSCAISDNPTHMVTGYHETLGSGILGWYKSEEDAIIVSDFINKCGGETEVEEVNE